MALMRFSKPSFGKDCCSDELALVIGLLIVPVLEENSVSKVGVALAEKSALSSWASVE